MRAGLSLIAALAATSAFAADQPPAELRKLRTDFATAVAKKDQKAVEKLTAFPLRNIVYRAPKTVPASKFKAQMQMYVELASCIKADPLTPATKGGATPKGEWEINCDGNVLAFGLRNGAWKHTGYENINE
ncbi:MAG: hypothetical protein KDJ25_06990 [Rhodoblastus sp.]|nr:hypothetical protein [Rhodoblastus sp.]